MKDKQPWWKKLGLDIAASIVFYTSIPLTFAATLDFSQVARYAPLVGILIGGILALFDVGLHQLLKMPVLTRSALVVGSWVMLTGGLHLDGAMDTADGLAVQDPQRRLQVMADSATGAFGAMSAIAILLLKTAALSEISSNRWIVLIAACSWGRWGQQFAIVRYPYLKPTGKGAFHKVAMRSPIDLLPGLFLLFSLSGLQILMNRDAVIKAVVMVIAGSAIAFLTSAWFNHKLGGHTGDTYGAVVEWTEALFLCVMTVG